jgi:hypothetical protein
VDAAVAAIQNVGNWIGNLGRQRGSADGALDDGCQVCSADGVGRTRIRFVTARTGLGQHMRRLGQRVRWLVSGFGISRAGSTEARPPHTCHLPL